MKHKFQKVKIGKVEVVKENKKWAEPMKPRVPREQVFADPDHPSRAVQKRELREQLDDLGM